MSDWLDEEGYPNSNSGSSNPEYYLDPAEFSSKLQFASFDLRWHQVFPIHRKTACTSTLPIGSIETMEDKST
jgi:hypothetical protein